MAEWLVIETMKGTEIMIRVKNVHRDGVNDSMHRWNDEEFHRETTRELIQKMGGSKDKQQEESNEDMDREYDKLEDYQENIAVQLAEQEEDELERIKEESGRRRQAILEKYNNKQQNPLTTLQVDTLGDSPAQVEFAEVVPDESDNHVEGPDDYAPELSFVVEKLSSQNGLHTVEIPTGTGGLVEGMPKAIPLGKCMAVKS